MFVSERLNCALVPPDCSSTTLSVSAMLNFFLLVTEGGPVEGETKKKSKKPTKRSSPATHLVGVYSGCSSVLYEIDRGRFGVLELHSHASPPFFHNAASASPRSPARFSRAPLASDWCATFRVANALDVLPRRAACSLWLPPPERGSGSPSV